MLWVLTDRFQCQVLTGKTIGVVSSKKDKHMGEKGRVASAAEQGQLRADSKENRSSKVGLRNLLFINSVELKKEPI